MEINIKVTIELPEWAEKLAQQIVNNAEVKPVTAAKPAEKPATDEKPADSAPANEEKPAKPAKPRLGLGKTKPAEKPATDEKPADEAPADEAPACKHTLEELREIMPTKFEGNAATIKAKLGEFDTVSLSKLDPKYYDAMYDFLMSL